ncbi:MAG: protease Lon-related BREX system protein BrxL [Gemmatimonas sp.]|nr:protease Lon-related BREX system protein BrxL [Gemmatimonas sp.]
MEAATTISMDELDRLANDAFAGRVVRKDLVRQVKVGANVPVYVLEFLLGKYCASDDPAAIATGLQVVNETLAENFIRPDEAEKSKARLKRQGEHRLIDKVSVRLLASEDKYWAELANFGDKFVHVPEDVVYRYERLLQGGVWSQLDLLYNAEEDEAHKRPFYIRGLKPIQVAAFSIDEYAGGRERFSRDDWLDLIVRSIGLEPGEFDLRRKLLYVTRLIPMAERNYNLVELGPWGTGKSFVYRETSPNAILISGGKTTVAQLFVHMGTGKIGMIGTWDTVAFDEVAGIEFSDSTVVQILKDYMESGSFARGKEEMPAEASLVFLGNTSKPAQELVRAGHLFADLPKAMIDPAFLDRIHFYLPGWETPKMEHRFFTGHYGFVSDYLAEALRELRRRSYVGVLDTEFALGDHLSARDERAVRKTVSGLLKILHPDEQWTRSELREYVEFGIEGRRRVKEQLKKLAPHDYSKTAFSYTERDTGHEVWVEVPEQPEEAPVEQVIEAEQAGPQREEPTPPAAATMSEVIAAGESSSVEFKQSARWNEQKGDKDPALELAVLKTVAGFMNAHGGILLIGVSDGGKIVGVEPDFQAIARGGRDRYENWLTTLFETSLGKPAAAHTSISFEEHDGHEVCRVYVEPSRNPVYITKGNSADLYVRINNSTRLLNTADAVEYIAAHWRR